MTDIIRPNFRGKKKESKEGEAIGSKNQQVSDKSVTRISSASNERIQRFDRELGEKSLEMLQHFTSLKITDPRAAYREESVNLRKRVFSSWPDDALKVKMLDGYPALWTNEPAWWQALVDELCDRGFLPDERDVNP